MMAVEKPPFNAPFTFAALLALACVPVFSQEAYPARPITLIVPFPPGGVADLTGRPTAIALEGSDAEQGRTGA